MSLELTEIRGVGKITAERLTAAGLTSIRAVAEAELETIVSATHFPAARASAIHQAANQLWEAEAPTQETSSEPTKGSSSMSKDKKKADKKKDSKKKADKKKDRKKKADKKKDSKKGKAKKSKAKKSKAKKKDGKKSQSKKK